MKKKAFLGSYVLTECCIHCDWFLHPFALKREVCPSCGNEINQHVGRYKIEITKKVLQPEVINYIGFVRGFVRK